MRMRRKSRSSEKLPPFGAAQQTSCGERKGGWEDGSGGLSEREREGDRGVEVQEVQEEEEGRSKLK